MQTLAVVPFLSLIFIKIGPRSHFGACSPQCILTTLPLGMDNCKSFFSMEYSMPLSQFSHSFLLASKRSLLSMRRNIPCRFHPNSQVFMKEIKGNESGWVQGAPFVNSAPGMMPLVVPFRLPRSSPPLPLPHNSQLCLLINPYLCCPLFMQI